MDDSNIVKKSRNEYYDSVNQMGKKEFTLLKMQEYGFWPKDLPTPYEIQNNESKEDYNKRKKLIKEYEKIANDLIKLYEEKSLIAKKLLSIKKDFNETWDYDKIRKDIAKTIMKESLSRRSEKKKQKELEKIRITEEWNKKKLENIIFIGKGYSNLLFDKSNNETNLISLNLPIINDDIDLAKILEISYQKLRFLTYHRDVVITDHYFRYTIPKKSGGFRNIAAPKKELKTVQRKILELILEKINISDKAHGFVKERSVVTGANLHNTKPKLLINIDIENFFPTITFERVRGMFKSFGYSGYISSLLAMLCTYCERMPIDIKGETRYVKTSDRILPQGSPASPMITNIICKRLDSKISILSEKFNFKYSRYADDMSFSFNENIENKEINKILHFINSIVNYEGFKINRKKTRYLRKNNRQCITGIVINNDQIGVPKVWVRKMRSAIYNANNNTLNKELNLKTINKINGMSNWLMSVNKERYKNILLEAQKILKK